MATREELTWDLSAIIDGFDAFDSTADRLMTEVRAMVLRADALGAPGQDDAWTTVIPALADLSERVGEALSWAHCAAAADTEDPRAGRAEARGTALYSLVTRAWSTPTSLVARCDADAFALLVGSPALADHLPALDRARARRPVLLPPGEQQLLDELAEDALHGWGQRYRHLSGRLRIELDGQRLSPGQAKNRLESPEPELRSRTMDAMEAAWGLVAEDCADTLTHLIGVRQTVNDRLGVDELAVPLVAQRIQPQTLAALIEACRDAQPLVGRYLAARARAQGSTQVDWQDMAAPLGPARLEVDYDQARQLVAEQVAAFSPDMGAFVRHALAHRWVEAEDRPGKRPGAFCASFPRAGESRVFLTYGGGPGSVRTLAHELGHAYHNWVMVDLPWAHRRLTSCLAETASTFAEAVVRDALLAQAQDPQTRFALLDRELADATTFLANIPVRFEFERSLFALRRQGPLSVDALSDRMVELQRAWYGPRLGRAFPLFWAEKLHFYLTHSPFYNFPYTFGYLFSGMVYARARQEGPAWAEGYRQLLRATGSGSGEVVAQRFLGADLTRVDTWSQAIQTRLEPLVDELEALVDAGC